MNEFLGAQQCWLRPLAREDLPQVADWSHDREVTRHLYRGTFPTYAEDADRAYDAMVKASNEYELAVMWRPENRFVGVAGLHTINWIARSAEFRILLGDRDSWGHGIGTEVAQLLTAWGIEILNLRRIWLGVNAANVGAHRSYEKAGFVHEGILRQEVFRNGEYHDVVRMSLLGDEYYELKKTWAISKHLERQFPRP